MSSNLKIRNATVEDVREILDIVNYAIIHTTSNYLYDQLTLEDQQQWFEHKTKNKLPVLVAEQNNQVIGFATYGTFREKIGYQYTIEHSVYLAAESTGKGIGTQLMQNLIHLAKQQGYHSMIGGIDAANEGSIAFHKKLGFEETGLLREVGYKFDRWLDLQFMQLILK